MDIIEQISFRIELIKSLNCLMADQNDLLFHDQEYHTSFLKVYYSIRIQIEKDLRRLELSRDILCDDVIPKVDALKKDFESIEILKTTNDNI